MDRARREAGRVGRHKEAGEAAVGLLRIGLGEDQRELRVVAHRDPLLLAVQLPAAVDLRRAGLQAGGVGARAGLGEAEAAERLAATELGQPLVLLLLGAPALDGRADERRLHRHDGARRGVAAADLLHDQAVGAVVEPAVAVLLGDDRAEEAHVRHLLDELGVEPLVAVVVARHRHDLFVCEVARGLADQALLVGQLEVDQVGIPPGKSARMQRSQGLLHCVSPEAASVHWLRWISP